MSELETTAKRLIGAYETLATKSAAMLDAARRSDWDTVSAIEEECSALIVRLKSTDQKAPLSPSLQERKVQIIRRVLLEDAEIRDLAQPQLAKLGKLINITGTQRRVERAYS